MINHRVIYVVLGILLAAAVVIAVLLFGAIEREQAEELTREQTIEQLGTDLYELALEVCAIHGGTLEPVEVDDSGDVIAADCVIEGQ